MDVRGVTVERMSALIYAVSVVAVSLVHSELTRVFKRPYARSMGCQLTQLALEAMHSELTRLQTAAMRLRFTGSDS